MKIDAVKPEAKTKGLASIFRAEEVTVDFSGEPGIRKSEEGRRRGLFAVGSSNPTGPPLTNFQSPDPHPLPQRSVDIREPSIFETASAIG